MRGPRLLEWTGPKHPECDGLLTLFDRTGQVWEDDDGWIFFIVGAHRVATYYRDGKPFQYEHKVFVINSQGESAEWPLFETNDRTLEMNDAIHRLA